ncbi:hypothetical protein H0H81_005172 [Sphagnurus paluster]|uniref:Uncharacterized protein n=1 Tax=Sphagnurus paluster TaxID=117069 RepID=A0A9P7FVY6_9AGAR|nr:hypothetical protein H0H81_005172 [Sphagnurus paluster]
MSSSVPHSTNAFEKQSVSFDKNNSGESPSSTRATVGPGDQTEYPEQRHAGKVGYGPAYHTGPTLGDKIKGFEEEIKGKLTRNPALVQHGKELISGELKAKERERDMNEDPFAKGDQVNDKPAATARASSDPAAPVAQSPRGIPTGTKKMSSGTGNVQ